MTEKAGEVNLGLDRTVCPNCATPNRGAARFCTRCGAPLQLPDAPAQLLPSRDQIRSWSDKSAGARRASFEKLGIRGVPVLLAVCGNDLYLAAEQGGRCALYGMNAKGIKESREARDLGLVPEPTVLVAPLIATHDGVFAIAADRIVCFRAHGPGADFSPYQRMEWLAGADRRLLAATPGVNGIIWVVAACGGSLQLLAGNGQWADWRLVRTFGAYEIEPVEGATLWAEPGAVGEDRLVIALRGLVVVFSINSLGTERIDIPQLEMIPASWLERARCGFAYIQPSSSHRLPPFAPIFVHSKEGSNGVALLATDSARVGIRPVFATERPRAMGYARDGSPLFVFGDRLVWMDARGQRLEYVFGPGEFDAQAEDVQTSLGAAGDWIAFTKRQGSNLAEVSLIKPDARGDLVLQSTHSLAGRSDQAVTFGSLPPTSTADAFYLVVLHNGTYSLLFCDLTEPGDLSHA